MSTRKERFSCRHSALPLLPAFRSECTSLLEFSKESKLRRESALWQNERGRGEEEEGRNCYCSPVCVAAYDCGLVRYFRVRFSCGTGPSSEKSDHIRREGEGTDASGAAAAALVGKGGCVIVPLVVLLCSPDVSPPSSKPGGGGGRSAKGCDAPSSWWPPPSSCNASSLNRFQ